MQISWDTFYKCIQDIQNLSDHLNDNWIMCKDDEGKDEFSAYLLKKHYISCESETLISMEYHVVYNMSYGIPMLCMNASRSDGTLLKMEELWACLNFTKEEDMYSTLTQMDHPVLQRPFLTLHPCKTAELLDDMFRNSKNVVASWLSAVGPIVKLNVDLNYIKLT